MLKPQDVLLDPSVVAHREADMLDYVTYTSTNSAYVFHCYAMPGSALTDAAWAVKRTTAATARIQWLTGGFAYAATNLATVEGYFA